MAHWHVASGLTGYGPDGSDGTFASLRTPVELADAIREELAAWSESEAQSADAYAEAEDYKSAWFLAKHADEIETMRAELDNARADAPLYRGAPQQWDATILHTVREFFPYRVDEGRSGVYAWECETDDAACEHLNDQG